MTHTPTYIRDLQAESDSSLRRIAQHIHSGMTVLDLGMGAGTLGAYLQNAAAQVVIDGVSINPEEVALAAPHYRHTWLADLETAQLSLLTEQRYDRIVCADVLEHLRNPTQLLSQLPGLLKPGGQVLVSIPNLGYAGLVAELAQGQFRYRPEGLLDVTHLRFFTRQTLLDWLSEQGWAVHSLETVHRALSDSEFAASFDALPPLVARYLLSRPEALAYQFVLAIAPAAANTSHEVSCNDAGKLHEADFAAALYWRSKNGPYSEAFKSVQRGLMGCGEQTLVFVVPALADGLQGLRLDPCDRPGFLHMHRIEIRVQGDPVWQWPSSATEPLDWKRHEVVVATHPGQQHAVMLATGHDPWLELDLPPTVYERLAQGAEVHVTLGWPMSSDFMVLANQVRQLDAERRVHRDEQTATAQALAQQVADAQQLQQQLHDEQTRRAEAQALVRDIKGSLRLAHHEQARLNQENEALRQHLQRIESSTVFRVTRPLVKLKMAFDAWRQSSSPSSVLPMRRPRIDMAARDVDVIVPVYRGLADTQRCLESVIAAVGQTQSRLVVINDASPEPELVDWLALFAEQHRDRVVLLHNPQNLGFVETVNRGMALSDSRDVVLLNSDAEVHGNWLDRMQAAAYGEARVATVTPFSNNATICSYPKFCAGSALPPTETVGSLDALCADLLAGLTVELPTGHGFCLYIRRDALQALGLFDAETFGRGYGEENDFCQRALQAGWLNLQALDVYVGHAGSVSFGSERDQRVQRAMALLRERYPQYEPAVYEFIRRDPTRGARLLLDLARLTRAGSRLVLIITHNRQGGTQRHQLELAKVLADRAQLLIMSPAPGGVLLQLAGPDEGMALHVSLPQERMLLLDLLRRLRLAHVHVHHVLDHDPWVLSLPNLLGLTHDVTLHDYYTFCPQISLTDLQDRYCGERGIEQCRQCVAQRPAPGGVSIEAWRHRHRALLHEARQVIVPVESVARRARPHAPASNFVTVPHSDIDPTRLPAPWVRPLAADGKLRVAVIGALSRIKGADLLEATARRARQRGLALEFHLIGYGYRQLDSMPRASLVVHGPYADDDLLQLLTWIDPQVAWFPALWPETYSYTLSACLEAGLPVVAPDFGAFADRLTGRPLTTLLPWDSDPDDFLAVFEALRLAPAPATARPAVMPSTGTEPSQSLVFYRNHYLEGLPAAGDALPLPALLEILTLVLPLADRGQKLEQSSRRLILRVLQYLRRHPALSWLVRLVPSHVQRAVRAYLGV